MIDTAAKRRSAAGCGLFLLGPGVTPGASGSLWRGSAAFTYAGNAFNGAIEAVAEVLARLRYRFAYGAS